jgi:hypothetical protein
LHGILEINESKEVVRLPVKKHLSKDKIVKIRTQEIDDDSPESLADMKAIEDFVNDCNFLVKMDQLCRGKLRTIAGNMAKSCLGCKPM